MSPVMDAPGMDDDDEALLERFLDAVWMEHGLSDHTLAAYRADLKGIALFLRKQTVTAARRGRRKELIVKPATDSRNICLRPKRATNQPVSGVAIAAATI